MTRTRSGTKKKKWDTAVSIKELKFCALLVEIDLTQLLSLNSGVVILNYSVNVGHEENEGKGTQHFDYILFGLSLGLVLNMLQNHGKMDSLEKESRVLGIDGVEGTTSVASKARWWLETWKLRFKLLN